MGPYRFTEKQFQTEDPWQKLYDALAKAKQNGSIVYLRKEIFNILYPLPEGDKTLKEIRYYISKVLYHFYNEKEYAALMDEVKGNIGKTSIEPKKDEFMQFSKIYDGISAYVKSMRDKFDAIATKMEKSGKLKGEELSNFVSDYNNMLNNLEQYLLSSTDPKTAFQTIAWENLLTEPANEILKRFNKIIDTYNLAADDKKELQGYYSSLEEGFKNLVRTQRALDGLDLVIKSKAFGTSLEPAVLASYFKGILLPNEVERLKDKPSELVARVFETIKESGSKYGWVFPSLVLESNFGENCLLLEKVYKDMTGKSLDANKSVTERAELFYSAMASSKGLLGGKYSDRWKSFQSHAGSLASQVAQQSNLLVISSLLYSFDIKNSYWQELMKNKTVNKRELVYSSDAGKNVSATVFANKSGVSADDVRKSKEFADLKNLKEGQSKSFIIGEKEFTAEVKDGKINFYATYENTGSAESFLKSIGVIPMEGEIRPPVVAATILQNTDAVENIFMNSQIGTQSFDVVMKQVADNVSMIYSQPFGSYFSTQHIGTKDDENRLRTRAAQEYLDLIKKIPNYQVLDLLMNTIYQNMRSGVEGWEGITPAEIPRLLLDFYQSYDFTNLDRRMQYYEALPDRSQKIVRSLHTAYNQYINELSRYQDELTFQGDNGYYRNNNTPFTPTDTMMWFINSKFNEILKVFNNYNPNYVDADVSGQSKNVEYKNWNVNGTIDLSGNNSSILNTTSISGNTQNGSNTVQDQFQMRNINLSMLSSYVYNFTVNAISTSVNQNNTNGDNQTYLEQVDQSLNGYLNMKSGGKDFVVDFTGRRFDRSFTSLSPDEQKKEIENNLDLHTNAYVRTNSGWYRVKLDQLKIKSEDQVNGETNAQTVLDKEYTRYFATNRTIWSPTITTDVAVETQKQNGVDRFGFSFGYQNTWSDKQVATWGSMTPSKNWVVSSAYGWDMKTQPKVVYAGVIGYTSEETTWDGQKKFDPSGVSVFAGVNLAKEFYAFALVGGQYAGGKFQYNIDKEKTISANVLLQYPDKKVENVQGNVSYTSKQVTGLAYWDVDMRGKDDKGGAALKIKVGEKTYLYLSGDYDASKFNQQLLDSEFFRGQAQSIWQRIQTAKTESEAESITKELFSLLERYGIASNVDFAKNQTTKFSIGMVEEGPAGRVNWGWKVSLTRAGDQSYLIGMADLSNDVSVTFGLNTTKEKLNGDAIRQFGGVRFNLGQTTFMATVKNSVDGKFGGSATVIHKFDGAKDWLIKAGLAYDEKNNKIKGDIQVGNQSFNVDLNYQKMQLENNNYAQKVGVATELLIDQLARIWAGVDVQYMWADNVTGLKMSGFFEKTLSDNSSLKAEIYYQRGKVTVAYDEVGVKLTISSSLKGIKNLFGF